MAASVHPLDHADIQARPHRYFRRRYVWQWPLRLWHWVNAVTVTILFFTGLYISWPLLAPAGEAYRSSVMGTVRMIHFICGFLFFVNFMWRIYWFWFGNNYARSGFPFFWRLSWWKDLFRQIFDYLKLERGHVHLGHGSLGGLSYTLFVILLGWAQILTGFALYSEGNPGGFWDFFVGWIPPLLGGSFQVHMWHHLFSYGFLFFAILHIYIVFYDGLQYKNGLVTSIITGEKFFREGDLDHDRWVS